ncbi:MAG: hypothetical protein JEZ08_11640 [Clostridiales bacterium]|nr:hypothetical protein [Clostridiales bacterium]
MKDITKDELMNVMKKMDHRNRNNFDSFAGSIKQINEMLSVQKIEDIIDYFVFELFLNSDADLYELGQYELGKITSGINSIIND